MKHSILHFTRIALIAGAALNLAACATSTTGGSTTDTATTSGSTASVVIEAALPIIRTGAAVATGAVLDFTVQQSGTRTRLANEMYAAASAVYSLSGGSFPTPTQLQGTITAFGGSETDASYAQFSSAIASLYAAWYPKLASGDAKTASDLLNAVAGGIEDATQSYVTTPASVALGIPTGRHEGDEDRSWRVCSTEDGEVRKTATRCGVPMLEVVS